MKRVVIRIREVEKIENPLVELSALHTMITQIHQIISQRIRMEEASASENSYTPHTETDEEKSQRLVKQSIDDCIKELQNIQTRLMKYKRNEVSWYTKDSIEAMRRSIQSANRTIQTIIGDKEDQDVAFKKSPKDEDIRFAKWAIDSAYKVASMYSIEINKKLRLFNKEMVIDHPELKPFEIKNKEGG